MRDHKRLKAFKLADALVLKIYEATKGIPASERFGLTDQLRRAAVSTAANIVEGCARNSPADYLRFLDFAYGSAKEAEYLISVAFRLKYLSETFFGELESRCNELSKVLGSLIISLRRE